MSKISYHQIIPNTEEAEVARISGKILSRLAQRDYPVTLCVMDDESLEPLHLPNQAVNLLMTILEAMANGQNIKIIPDQTELTTMQAANILGVSRPYLIKLLETEQIPYRKVGKHRRILMEDVMAYKQAIDAEREVVLDQLVADAQAQDMGYGNP